MNIKNIDKIVENEIKSHINETNKIRPMKPEDYPYPQLDNVDFDKIQKTDDAYNKKYDLDSKSKVNTQRDLYQNPQKGIPSKEIERYQKELTNNVQDRALEKTGSIYQSSDTFEISDAAKKRLDDAGLKLEIKGKTFGYGNKKLPADTMIINLTSAFNCPALHCLFRHGVCYANKGEKTFIDSQMRNLRNEFALPYLSLKEILKLVEMYIEAAPCKIHRIRLSEDGDFKSQEIVDFCDKLAGHILAKYGITTTCYTHQRFDFTRCNNLIVNSSLPGNAIKGADRNFIAIYSDRYDSLINDGKIHQDERGNYYFLCHCNCKACNFCYNTKAENGEPEDARVNVYERLRGEKQFKKEIKEKQNGGKEKPKKKTAKKKTTKKKPEVKEVK